MPRRATSPAASEAEADIFDSLYTQELGKHNPTQATVDAGFDFLDNAPDGEENGDDDDKFIALQQAASYRKTSQMKSSTAKKSGQGFQTMGAHQRRQLVVVGQRRKSTDKDV